MKDTYELIDLLVGQDLDYIHASLDNVSSKPVDSQDEKTRLELILERANGKVPVMAAGSIVTPDDALRAVELGLPLVAIGHALIIDPNWVEKIATGREAEVDSELNISKLDQLNIPEKLSNVIQAMPGWFNISK